LLTNLYNKKKIKYPVGSIIDAYCKSSRKVVDLTKNEFACLLQYMDGTLEEKWFTQKQLDDQGYALVSSPRWIPEMGDQYWTADFSGHARWETWDGNQTDIFNLKRDNVFKTREECQKKIDEINSREI